MDLPTDPKKIRQRIRRYERALRQELEEFGGHDDSAGKRYLIGPLYLLMGDLDGALDSFAWFEREFPHDIGDAGQYLCWALALHRCGGQDAAATRKLRQAMLMNLYLIPHLLGEDIERLDIWHGSNLEEPEYLGWLPGEYLELWLPNDIEWAKAQYHGEEMTRVREHYIEIHRQLLHEPRGEKRSRLVREAMALLE